MIPLVDIHCHLLAGLDDGPRTQDDAVAMCRMAYAEGVRLVAATGHQNERWSAVTPQRIREATQKLRLALADAGIAMTVFPNAEVMAHPDLGASWRDGKLLSVGDSNRYMLLEMPHRLFVDLLPSVRELRRHGIRPILAHPERESTLLHGPGEIERLIEAGCIVQVSSGSVTSPASPADGRALKDWFRRGLVHVLGSDGHSPRRRLPLMADAYRQIRRWVGRYAADRIASTQGLAILNGLPVRVPRPSPRRRLLWMVPRLW